MRRGSQGRGHRTVEFEGYEILVGKGDRDNDHLTFKVGRPRDLWLHVAGTPGSHVVVRNPEGLAELPPQVVEHAAKLALYHSKSRNAGGKVNVHVCPVSAVSKAPGAPAGQVRLKRYDTVKVYPPEVDPVG
jgi:predicted ribosome quality control (RQC) complex YloA/Tae2 family protein